MRPILSPDPDAAQTIEVHPSQLGWKLAGKDENGHNIWKTDKGEFYKFPPKQKELLVVRRA